MDPNNTAGDLPSTDSLSLTSAGEVVSAAMQRRNLICYIIIRMLLYTAAPATYGDVMWGTLIERMGGSHTLLNLPGSLAGAAVVMPVFISWLIPHRRFARRVVVVAFALQAFAGIILATAIAADAGFNIVYGSILLHAILCRTGAFCADVFTWDILSKGMSETTRGKTLAWAFGTGPLFAVGSSLLCDHLLKERVAWLQPPYDFAAVFGLSAPVLVLAAVLASRYYVPPAVAPETRPSFLQHTFGGLWDFVRQRKFILLLLAWFLVEVGLLIVSNAAVYTREAMGIEPKTAAGTMFALRFAGKIVVGFLLGFLVARRGARAGAMSTAALAAAGGACALTMTGAPYLGTFALLGAGELAGVYFPNYCVSASKPEAVKRNLSFYYLTSLVVAVVPVMHGAIGDLAGVRADFAVGVAAAVLCMGTIALLPVYRPVPKNAVAEEESPVTA